MPRGYHTPSQPHQDVLIFLCFIFLLFYFDPFRALLLSEKQNSMVFSSFLFLYFSGEILLTANRIFIALVRFNLSQLIDFSHP